MKSRLFTARISRWSSSSARLHTSSGFIAAEGTGARRVEQDKGDINKSLKMALKSAHIDATLRVASLSELFTQDIEDLGPDRVEPQKFATHSHGSASKNPSADAEEVEFCNGIPVVRTPPAPPSNPPVPASQAGPRRREPEWASQSIRKTVRFRNEPPEARGNDQERAGPPLCRDLRSGVGPHFSPGCIQPHRLAPESVISVYGKSSGFQEGPLAAAREGLFAF